MKPRLLIFINRLVVGGQSIDTIPLANHLNNEYDILVVYGEKEKDEMEYTSLLDNRGVNFKKISSLKRRINPFNDIHAFFTLFELIRNFKPDIVHTHGAKPGVIGRLAAWFAKVPVIVHTFHGHLFHSYYNRFVSYIIVRMEKLLGRISTKVVVLGSEQKREISERYKIIPSEKIDLIPLGIDENEYTDDAAILRAGFRKKAHLTDDAVAISIIGRIVPVKNHLLFIDIIINLLPQIKENVKFFFIGDGYFKAKLQTHLSNAGITWGNDVQNCNVKIIFTSWVTPITSVLHGMDIVALTSFNEGTPVSLIEAQICSKPVVAVDVGGVRDTFINNESGFLISDHNVAEFTDKLSLLIQNKELRRSMGEKGYLFAKEKFSKQTEVNAFRKLYADCLCFNYKKII
ncbi:MAG TPA: glycosyltransferase family 4 protein [Chitinophagaceae bacterium]|nr:glycosyltransferase family 4 protein [Chitinophagaceae bacterium]